jgi:TolB-like protein
LQIINVNDDAYVVRGTVLAQKVTHISTEELKSQYSLADTVLRNGDTLYICMKIVDAEFTDIK